MPSAASKTAATKKSAAKKTAEPAKQGPQQIVPALPEGWEMTLLAFTGPSGESVAINSANQVAFTSTDGTVRKAQAESLALALRAAGTGIRALDKVAQQQKKAEEAQAAALAVLGDIDETPAEDTGDLSTDGLLDEPVGDAEGDPNLADVD